MGQGWSDNVGQVESTVLRNRADSEPPTSWGGHAVSCIPEDEEVNIKTSDIQYADWKKASGASGILRDKCNIEESVETHQPQEAYEATAQPRRSRALSLDYTHLSDFSMFPDKFSTSSSILTPKSPEDVTVPATPPSTPLSNLTATIFRTRASSTSEPMERPEKEVEIQQDTMCSSGSSLQIPDPQFRPRSASYSGRLPFFDFSMIPDKDPLYKGDKQCSSGHPEKASSIVAKPDGPSVVAHALTMAASMPPQAPEANSSSSPPKAAPQITPRFTFFDYSMIPDKDPRAFVPNREVETKSSQN